jgi:hypothetical protein
MISGRWSINSVIVSEMFCISFVGHATFLTHCAALKVLKSRIVNIRLLCTYEASFVYTRPKDNMSNKVSLEARIEQVSAAVNLDLCLAGAQFGSRLECWILGKPFVILLSPKRHSSSGIMTYQELTIAVSYQAFFRYDILLVNLQSTFRKLSSCQSHNVKNWKVGSHTERTALYQGLVES